MPRKIGPAERVERTLCIRIVYDRSRGFCERCGRPGQSYHHRKNRSQGGRWEPTNIVHLCGDGTCGCHGWVTDHPADGRLEGYHVKPWETPESVPVLLFGAQWALLRNDGSYNEIAKPEEESP